MGQEVLCMTASEPSHTMTCVKQ